MGQMAIKENFTIPKTSILTFRHVSVRSGTFRLNNTTGDLYKKTDGTKEKSTPNNLYTAWIQSNVYMRGHRPLIQNQPCVSLERRRGFSSRLNCGYVFAVQIGLGNWSAGRLDVQRSSVGRHSLADQVG